VVEMWSIELSLEVLFELDHDGVIVLANWGEGRKKCEILERNTVNAVRRR